MTVWYQWRLNHTLYLSMVLQNPQRLLSSPGRKHGTHPQHYHSKSCSPKSILSLHKYPETRRWTHVVCYWTGARRRCWRLWLPLSAGWELPHISLVSLSASIWTCSAVYLSCVSHNIIFSLPLQDPTAYPYQFQDDPYLSPKTSTEFVRQKHTEIYTLLD